MKKQTGIHDTDKNKKKTKKGSSALAAASLGRSATAQARHHTHTSFDTTGTNVSYEGATAPGAGGSVGNGYASGKEATGARISTNSDFDQNRGGRPSKAKSGKKKGDSRSEDPDFEGEF